MKADKRTVFRLSLLAMAMANVSPALSQDETASDAKSLADEWLQTAPADSYTIQLATVFGHDTCLSVAKQNSAEPVYCFESSTVPNRFFAVTGTYASKSLARQAGAQLGVSDFLVNYIPRIIETRCEMPNPGEHFKQRCADVDSPIAVSEAIQQEQPATAVATTAAPEVMAVTQESIPRSQAAQWLQAAPANSYTVQLATLFGHDNCLSIAEQYPAGNKVYCFESSTVPNRWFAVTGTFANRQLARQAGKQLATSDIWVNYIPRILETRCEMADPQGLYRPQCSASGLVKQEPAPKLTPAAPVAQNYKPAAPPQEQKAPIAPGAATECKPVDNTQGRPRRRPSYPVLVFEYDVCDPNRLSLPKARLLPDPAPVPDRWRIVDALGYAENLWDPYSNNNPIKGDKPVFGKDWFVNLSVISDSIYEPRKFPVPVGGATTSDTGDLDLIADGDQYLLAENLLVESVLYKGDTVFRPPDHEFRLITVLNINHTVVDERGLLKADPSQGTTRTESFLGIQGAFWDYHIRNVSDRFDFDSFRIGIQPFSSDFRGFLFQDNQLGIRLFGTRDNNIFQYNLAWFRRLEKESNSGLNDISENPRDDDVFIANLYWQDFPRLGFTSQATVIHNRNRESSDFYFDHNQFIARPASLGFERSRDYDITYLGLSGDGHFGRNNLTYSAYYAIGDQSNGVFTNEETDVRAYFLAAELSRDYDWIRARASFLHSSGDSDPYDTTENGFDAIFENPQFAGADTAFFIRQNVPLIGGGRVALNGRNSIIPSLRSSKEHGQSNFTNPGLTLIGVGADFDITPQTRLSLNLNQMWFDDTISLDVARNQNNIGKNIGQDLSAAMIWRPLATQNVVFRLSGAVLIPGSGFKDLYGPGTPYSILANLILTY